MVDYSYKKCPICGIHYAVDGEVMRWKKDAPSSNKDRGWYCPNGHSLVFTESRADKERRRAERAEQRIAYEREQRTAAERSASAFKGQVTKLRKRARAGVCPCCNRQFQNLFSHMQTKHPDWHTEAVLSGAESEA